LVKDEFGRSKGYGFVQFANADDAKRAMEQLNGFELAGRPIKISHVTEKASESTSLSNLDSDELDRTGLNLGTSGKLALMAKLAEGTGLKLPQYTLDALNMATAAAAVASQTILSQESSAASNNWSAISTQCLMISNMFDIFEEIKKPNWVEDITDDVIEECTKYGGIIHIYVDESNENGNVYVKAPTIAIAMAITGALNGRYFGGKVIQTTFIPVANYHQLFPDSYHAQNLLQSRR
jgi:RNA-binding protein 39